MPTTRSTGTCTRRQTAFQARQHWGARAIHLGKRSWTSFFPLPCSPCPPLLEAVIDGHPNIKVDLGLSNIVLGKQAAQASGILLQHVCMILPSPALCEYLSQTPILVPPHRTTSWMSHALPRVQRDLVVLTRKKNLTLFLGKSFSLLS